MHGLYMGLGEGMITEMDPQTFRKNTFGDGTDMTFCGGIVLYSREAVTQKSSINDG